MNLGTLLKHDAATVSPGGSAVFEILLWSTDTEQFSVSFDSSAPKGWSILFNPVNVSLPAAKSDQYMGSVPAVSEKLFVVVPADAANGNYAVKVNAYAEGKGYPIPVSQGRSFDINITVIAGQTGNGSVMREQATSAPGKTHTTDAQSGGVPFIVVILSVLALLVISYMIYRR